MQCLLPGVPALSCSVPLPPPSPAPSAGAHPAPANDPRVDQIEAWWKRTYTLAVRDCRAFDAQLPRLRRDAGRILPGEPSDLRDVRTRALLLAEGIAHWAACRNDAARLALQSALNELERLLPRLTVAGLTAYVRRLIGTSHMYLGHVAHNAGDYAAALRAYLLVREIAQFGGFAAMQFQALSNISMIHGEAGLWELQLEQAREARLWAPQVETEVAVCQLDVMVAHAYRKLRDFASARQVLHAAIEVFRRHGWKGEELDAELRLAMLDLDEDKPREAIRRLHSLETLSREVARPHFEAARLAELGRASLVLGDHASAAAAMQDVIARFADATTFSDQAEMHLILGRVRLAEEDFPAAASEADRALQLLGQTGLPNELEAEAHGLLADAARRRGQWETACRAERARHEAYARHFHHQADLRARLIAIQHQIDVARAVAERERIERQRLEELLADVAARAQTTGSETPPRQTGEIAPAALRPLGLTARESEVLLWVSRGKTNEEIAIILGCGAETVKSHLKRIYQQLDVTNRAAAVAAALQGHGPAANGQNAPPGGAMDRRSARRS